LTNQNLITYKNQLVNYKERLIMAMEKEQLTLYLDPGVKEALDTYCYMAKRNRTRVMNEAIEDYVTGHLKNECEKEGLIK
jgi:hypothetical protein